LPDVDLRPYEPIIACVETRRVAETPDRRTLPAQGNAGDTLIFLGSVVVLFYASSGPSERLARRAGLTTVERVNGRR
jgi:hypothetical protein